METIIPHNTFSSSPLMTPQQRLALWQRVRGMWRNRKPDPITELDTIRKELDRKLPPKH